ncbi:hypothetical protein [Allostreptomyces psammosilenae]|uniref:HEAT repeat domain-containing protein n=1 Tax=Allostreptomyces psammosilenae TaxID=1892865 RepID=A0A852ZQ45_9ACTN|nr:hypothetical protein [Allostreptomyces psammosilenae]NYI04566.1 hypothetical protein [Allostreptomyces psammosilenae]
MTSLTWDEPGRPEEGSALAGRLVEELSALPHPAAMRQAAEHARALAGRGGAGGPTTGSAGGDGDPLGALIDELLAGGAYHRSVALHMVVAARRGDVAERLLAAAEPREQALALPLLGRVPVAPEALLPMLPDAPPELRRRLYRTLRRRRLTGHADAVVERVLGLHGETDAAALLPACGPATVARLLPRLDFSGRTWRALARHHPGLLLERAERELERTPEPLRPLWWLRHGPAVATAARTDPGRMLRLLGRAPGWGRVGTVEVSVPLAAALRADPEGTLDWLADHPVHLRDAFRGGPGRAARYRRGAGRTARFGGARTPVARSGLPGTLRAALRELPDAALRRLGGLLREHRIAAGVLTDALAALPPARRAVLYHAALPEHGLADGFSPHDRLLGLLPRQEAEAAARRWIAHEAARGEEESLHLRSWLPWPQARAALSAATADPDAEARALAWGRLLVAAARAGGPDPLEESLTLAAGRLRNERDPVRREALGTLADARRAAFHDVHVPALDRLCRDALEARDCSSETVSVVGRLAGRHLSADAPPALRDWAGRTLCQLVTLHGPAALGHPAVGRRTRIMGEPDARVLWSALRPWVVEAAARGRYGPLFEVAGRIGPRSRAALAEVEALLEDACRAPREQDRATAIRMWLEPRPTRDERVARVLAEDPSSIVLPPVWEVVRRRRVDLLDAALGDGVPPGAFRHGRPDWRPWAGREHHRWPPARQHAYRRLLLSLAGGSGAGAPATRTRAIEELGHVPDDGFELLRPFLDDERVPVAEAALAALARVDAAEPALDALLPHLDGDRARVAAHAAARCARRVRPSRLTAALLPLVDGGRPAEVTSRKEAVRLLAGSSAPRALPAVLAVLGDDGQHPDVRAAAVERLRRHSDRPEVQAVLRAAVEVPAVASAVLTVRPLEVPRGTEAFWARLICAVMSSSVARLRHRAVRAHATGRWATAHPRSTSTLADLLIAEHGDPGEAAAIAAALVQAAVDGGAPGALGQVVRRLAHADEELPEPPAGGAGSVPTVEEPRRRAEERPARRAVEAVVAALRLDLGGVGAARTDHLREVLDALREFPTYHRHTVQLGVAALDTDDPGALRDGLLRLVDEAGPHPLRLHALLTTVRDWVVAARRLRTPPTDETLSVSVTALVDRGTPDAALLAVTLITDTTGPNVPPTTLAQLRRLRAHPDPEVRGLARDVPLFT